MTSVNKVNKDDAKQVDKPASKPAPEQEPVVAPMPGSEYPSPNPPVDPESPEADPNPKPEVKEVTTADNPSPGRNAVPVEAELPTDGPPEGYEEKDLIPGTNVPQTATPKAGSMTR